LCIDNKKEAAAGEGQTQQLLFHSPLLGTWISFEIFNLLAYFRGQRQEIETTTNPANTSVITAPMPCKVLHLLKKTGDAVRASEVVLIVESMKMEMTISVGKDGVINCPLEEGVAVGEGVVLCSVECNFIRQLSGINALIFLRTKLCQQTQGEATLTRKSSRWFFV
jgi:biotin carboxyl carrier protein